LRAKIGILFGTVDHLRAKIGILFGTVDQLRAKIGIYSAYILMILTDANHIYIQKVIVH